MILIRQYLQLFIKFRVNKTLFCYLFPVVCIYRLCDIFPITVLIDYYYSMSQMCYVHVIFGLLFSVIMIQIRQYLQLFIKFWVNKTLFCYLFPVVCIYRLCDIFPITVFIDYYYSMSQMCYVHVIFVIMIQIRQYLQLFIKLRVDMTRFLLFISSRLYLPLV